MQPVVARLCPRHLPPTIEYHPNCLQSLPNTQLRIASKRKVLQNPWPPGVTTHLIHNEWLRCCSNESGDPCGPVHVQQEDYDIIGFVYLSVEQL